MIVKRLRFKNDEPATEKQVAFVQSLVAKKQEAARTAEAAAGRVNTVELETTFWKNVSIPADLTKKEASGIIEELSGGSGIGLSLPGHLESALDELEAGKATSATPGIMVVSVFNVAVNRILEM